MDMNSKGAGTREAHRDLIVTWHAQGHDALDGYDIPRFADGLEYTISERIEQLAGRPPKPRERADIHDPHARPVPRLPAEMEDVFKPTIRTCKACGSGHNPAMDCGC
jgi:hypothetical protein